MERSDVRALGLLARLLALFLPYFDITKKVKQVCRACFGTGDEAGMFECAACDGQGSRLVESLYLRRFFLWRGRRFNLFLHRFVRGDDDPDPHDHPWDFTTVVLTAGYIDEQWSFVENGLGIRARARGFNLESNKKHYAPPTDAHEIPGQRFYRRREHVYPLSIIKRQAEHTHRVQLNNGPAWTLVLTGPERRPWYFTTDTKRVFWRKYLGAWDLKDGRD